MWDKSLKNEPVSSLPKPALDLMTDTAHLPSVEGAFMIQIQFIELQLLYQRDIHKLCYTIHVYEFRLYRYLPG